MQCRGAVNAVTWKKKNKKILHLPCLFFSTFPFFSLLSFLNQISGTWQHKHQTLMWKTTPLHQKTCQSQSLSLSFSLSLLFLKHPCSFPHSLIFSPLRTPAHIPAHCNALPFLFFFLPPANLNPCIYWVTCTRKIWTPQVNAAHCYALDLFVLESRTLIMKTHNRDIQGCSGS